jgi:hypothetical protein
MGIENWWDSINHKFPVFYLILTPYNTETLQHIKITQITKYINEGLKACKEELGSDSNHRNRNQNNC